MYIYIHIYAYICIYIYVYTHIYTHAKINCTAFVNKCHVQRIDINYRTTPEVR